jgi:hypothetical protein
MAEKFRKTVKRHETEHTAGDYWKPYEHVIPKEKHMQTKCCSKNSEIVETFFPFANIFIEMECHVRLISDAF